MPRFVADLYDHATECPEHLRMLSWAHSPDRGDVTHDQEVRVSRRIAVVEAARRLLDPG